RRTGGRAGGRTAPLGASAGRMGPGTAASLRGVHVAGGSRARAALAAVGRTACWRLAGDHVVSEGIGPRPEGGYPVPERPTYPGPTRERWLWTGLVVGL